MPDPGKTVAATVRYEVKIVNGPFQFVFRSQQITLDVGEDLPVLARITTMGPKRLDEVIVAIIGSENHMDTRGFLALRAFLVSGGVIGLEGSLL